MNTLFILAVVALLGVAAVAIILVAQRNAQLAHLVPASNAAAGTHKGANVNRFASAAIGTKYLLGKKGAGDLDIAVCSVAGERSLGVITDEARAAGDEVNVAMHGGADGSRLVRAGGNIAVGDELTSLANAKAQKLPAAAGTYWIFGEALSAGADGDLIEYAPCKAQPRTV